MFVLTVAQTGSSVVSQVGNLRPVSLADCQSAKQQIINLRYAKSLPPGSHVGRLERWIKTLNFVPRCSGWVSV